MSGERRAFVRANFAMKVQYQPFDRLASVKPCTLEDLSGCGCRISIDRKLAVGTTIKVQFPTPGMYTMHLLCKVVRCAPQKKDPVNFWEAGLAFESVRAPEQDQLAQVVFKKHLEERRLMVG